MKRRAPITRSTISSTWNIAHAAGERGPLAVGLVTLVSCAARSARPQSTPGYRMSPRDRRIELRARVLDLVRAATIVPADSGTVTRFVLKEIAKRAGISTGSLNWHLAALAKRGLVRNVAYGDWRAVNSDTVSEIRSDH